MSRLRHRWRHSKTLLLFSLIERGHHYFLHAILPTGGLRRCRHCGCTWVNACSGGCSWADASCQVCSFCVDQEEGGVNAGS